MKNLFFLLLLSLALLVDDALAQTQDNFNIFQYRYVGPTRGGRVTAVAGIANQPNVFYMGATGGGVWKTDDYGTRWKNVSDGFFASPSIGAIAVAQNDPNIVYVGTGSDGLRSNVITGKGVYKSVDAGKSWSFSGLKNVGQIGAVEIHPSDNNTLFVAAIGQAFQTNPERGVYRTRDGGATWKKVLYLSDSTGVADIEFLPGNPNVLYAAAWRAERKPWTIISGGQENGIYKSMDGGDSWKKTGKGLPALMGKIDLAVCAADSKILYALVEARGKLGGLYRSENQGESFKQVSSYEALTLRPFYYTNVTVDPTDPETVYVMAVGYYRSTNGGKDWKRLNAPHGDHHDLWINPNNPQLQIQSNDGGANVTHNGGQSWSTQFNQPTAELYQVEVDNQYPYWLYAGQQDNYSTIAVPSLPPHGHQAGGAGFIINAGGCETGPAVPNPENSNIVYANCKGKFSVYNKATGQEQRYDVGALYMYGHNPKDLRFRFQRVSPIHISPHDAKTIYHTSQYVHRTTDEGKTWEIISPDLTAFEADKQVRSGSPISNDITGEEFYSTIYAIRESTVEKGLIWVGANDGPIHVTRDGGENWTDVTPKKLPKGGRVDCVEPSPHQAAKAYTTILRYQLGDWKPYIYRTDDYGKSWTLINNGIPADFPVRVVREDPDKEGLLYAGTEFGMFVSFNDGNDWQPFQQNLPVTPVTDIKIHRNDLVLATMGRGFFILDNLSTLHQGYAYADKSKPHLYQPEKTIRYRYPTFNDSGTGLPSPPYPRPAAIIDYYLPEAVKGGIQLQVFNDQGKLVRAFSSERIAQDSSVSRDMATNEFVYTINDKLKNKKGAHRFRWDLKHAGAWDKDEKKAYRNGTYAAPGTYRVVLALGDETLTQSLELVTDPRVLKSGVAINDIKEQEALALQVTDLLTKAKKKAAEVDRMLKELTAEQTAEKGKLEILKKKLVRENGKYTATRYINQVGYLLGIIQRADQAPGKDAYQRYEELNALFDKLIK